MIKTFKETYASLQSSSYGEIIINKSLREVIWYWTKYLLLISLIFVLIFVFFITNKLPQLPKLVDENFPEGNVSINNGILSSTVSQPFIIGNTDFSIVLDTAATESALGNYMTGILFTKDKMVLKSDNGQLSSRTYTNFPSFSTSKKDLSTEISGNLTRIWFILLLITLVIGLLLSLFIWLWRFTSFLIWSVIFLLIGRYVMKKTLNYYQVLKIVIYASVLPMIFSAVLSFSPNPILDILNMVVFAYFGFNWMWNLKSAATPVNVPPPVSSKQLPPKISSKKSKKT